MPRHFPRPAPLPSGKTPLPVTGCAAPPRTNRKIQCLSPACRDPLPLPCQCHPIGDIHHLLRARCHLLGDIQFSLNRPSSFPQLYFSIPSPIFIPMRISLL